MVLYVLYMYMCAIYTIHILYNTISLCGAYCGDSVTCSKGDTPSEENKNVDICAWFELW